MGESTLEAPPAKRPKHLLDYQHFVKSQEHLLQETDSNPQPTTVPPPSAGLAGAIGERHVISFIGLPARGKPFLAERLSRYLSFFHGARCRMFDLASVEFADDDALFPVLEAFLEEGDEVAATQVMMALDGIVCDAQHEEGMKRNVDAGRIAIVYSSYELKTYSRVWSGSSKERRWAMQRRLATLQTPCKLMFIEVIVTDPALVKSFIMQREIGCAANRRAKEPDRQATSEAKAEAQVQALEAEIKEYTRVFVTIQDDGSEDELSYMKLINYGNRIVTNNMRGFLCLRVVQYLSHVHPRKRTIYLSRHGQSTYNALHKIGGNPGLTPAGEAYAKWLGNWVPKHVCGDSAPERQRPCRMWTSSMRRTIDTARHIPHPMLDMGNDVPWEQMSMRVFRNLDEIFAGEYEGMTYEEIEKTSGGEAILRKKDKLGYRYPRGESYFDLIARLDALMHELESYTEPLVIISHQATLRMVYAYLMGRDRRDAPKIDFPLHTVIKIEYDGFGRHAQTATEERFGMTAVDGHNCVAEVANDGQKLL
mmetsp:Transcript_107679/g.303315  ORF Transcript_107679/g.303315 Transcript_107679/m.303315 type:complete len:536 (-) Transcript_107679:139-1746(-)